MKKICLCTTVHPRYDTRIFYKFSNSLKKNFNVCLVVADGLKNENIEGLEIIDIGSYSNRFERFFTSFIKFNFKILKIDSDIYQINDPELIIAGLILKMRGKKVTYDIHESYHEEVLNKYWLNPFTKKFFSIVIRLVEIFSTRFFDLNITATDYIKNHTIGNKLTIFNYPILKKNNKKNNFFEYEKNSYLTFVGAISFNRGIMESIKISLKSGMRLIFCGDFENEEVFNEASKYIDGKNIIYLGKVNYDYAHDLMNNAIAGFLLYHPGPNHNNSLPNKLFEYMSCNLPILATNIQKWKEIIDENNCGFTSNINDINFFSKKIKLIMNDKNFHNQLKLNCSKTIERYDWNTQEKILINEYSKLLNN